MQIEKFAKAIFDSEKAAKKASKIMEGVLQAKSPRISDIADQMKGAEAANYKMIQRFLKCEDLQEVLRRLFNEEAEFVTWTQKKVCVSTSYAPRSKSVFAT